MDKKKLFLYDGMPLIYRAHFSMLNNPRMDSQGRNVSAIFGYINILLNSIKQEKPTHLAVVFDRAEPTHRHKEYPPYKAQREKAPEDIVFAIPHVQEITRVLGIPVITRAGFEADDVIGTLAARADREGFTTYMVTPDKDFAQLVSDTCFIYKPSRGPGAPEILGVREILESWGIERVEQVIDTLGLAGDASDNIPGLPGVGDKTAQKLIAEFGSVENMLANTDKLKGKLKEKAVEFAAQALLSKRLVTILRDVPLDIELDTLKKGEPDQKEAMRLFSEFGFAGLAKRLFDEELAPPPAADLPMGQLDLFETAAASRKNLRDVKHDYRQIDSARDRTALIASLVKSDCFCLDLETEGLDTRDTAIIGIAIATQPNSAVFVTIPRNPMEEQAILAEFAPVFSNANKLMVGHNLKFDLSVLKWKGVEVRCRLFDTMLAHYLTDYEMPHTMDAMAETYLDYQAIPITALIGDKKEEQRCLRDVPAQALTDYACEDADITFQLYRKMKERLDELKLNQVFYDIECPLLPVLLEMEYAGVTIDSAALHEFSIELTETAQRLQARVFELAGKEFNINSPKQLGEVFFDDLKLEGNPPKTRTGQYATNEQVLQQLAPRHEIVQVMLDYRGVEKLRSTYVNALPDAINPRTNRIHTTYNQAVTATGRMQSQHPNLQNIPIRSEHGKTIRKAFIPRGKEFLLMSADYSQIELRIMGELSQDPGLLEAFSMGTDVHQSTAARVFNVAFDEVTREMRSKAKMVNFGIMYGISAHGLHQRLNIPRKEAAAIIEEYFRHFPKIKAYVDHAIAQAQEKGYVTTVTGRRRYIRDINSRNQTVRTGAERNAINAPIQGTAADMIKIAMVNIGRAMREGGFKSKMTMQVHDELVFDLHRDEQQTLPPLVSRLMCQAIPMQVPIEVELGIGPDWLAAH